MHAPMITCDYLSFPPPPAHELMQLSVQRVQSLSQVGPVTRREARGVEVELTVCIAAPSAAPASAPLKASTPRVGGSSGSALTPHLGHVSPSRECPRMQLVHVSIQPLAANKVERKGSACTHPSQVIHLRSQEVAAASRHLITARPAIGKGVGRGGDAQVEGAGSSRLALPQCA